MTPCLMTIFLAGQIMIGPIQIKGGLENCDATARAIIDVTQSNPVLAPLIGGRQFTWRCQPVGEEA